MSKVFKYKGYIGTIEFSVEDGVLFGKIDCINDLVTYEADTIPNLQLEFQNSVDDYLDTCQQLNKEPNKPMNGSFNVRIGEGLHKDAYQSAKAAGLTLNEFVKKAIEEKLSEKKEIHVHIEETEFKVAHGTFGFKAGKAWLAIENGKVH